MKAFKISATQKQGFCRCGVFFPEAGRIMRVDQFDDKQWARLKAEPKLRIEPASIEDVDVAEERLAQISEAINSLTADDFQRDGKPKVDALNALLADDLGKITASERDQVWSALQEQGFEAPKASS